MNEKAMAVYRGLLVEIKYRTEAIDLVLQGRIILRGKIAEELCYLQLRMICEIIAVGCLIIHGQMSAIKSDLLKTYKADWIMSEMAKLHPKFFPAPLENKDADTNPPSWIYKTTGFLTRADLATLWNKHAGSRLHRGNARNILKNDKALEFTEIRQWRDKIVNLLNRHTISSPDDQYICYFIMDNGKGEVASNLFRAIESP